MVKFIIVKYRKFQTVHENMSFLLFKPLGKSHYTKIDVFCGANISYTNFFNKLIHSTAFFYDIVLCVQFIWISISKYVNNGTTKVPISAKIGIRVQGSSSKIWI